MEKEDIWISFWYNLCHVRSQSKDWKARWSLVDINRASSATQSWSHPTPHVCQLTEEPS